jgi:hypothetical protein
MIIDRKLNLVILLERGEEEPPLYVHSTPIRTETFKTYHMALSKTFSTLMGEKLSITAGPGCAVLVLEDIARRTTRVPGVTWWEGPDGVEHGLIAEMQRLCNVIAPSPDGKGWGSIPLITAMDESKPLIGEEEHLEVMNQVAFFTVVSSVAPRKDRSSLIRGAAYLFDGQTTSLNSMDFANSLKMLKSDEDTGKKLPASSVPH